MTTDTTAQAPAPQAASAPVAAPTPAPQVVTFASTGDAALDMAHGYFAKHGVSPDSQAMLSAKAGDFSVLNAVLLEKGAEGAAAYVDIARQAHGRKAAAEQAAEQARTSMLHAAMGGEAQWLAVKAYVAEHATPEELSGINAALNSGGFAAKATAAYLKGVYDKAQGGGGMAGVQEPPVATTHSSGGRGTASQALSPEQFRAEVSKLVSEKGSGATMTAEYDALLARRQAYRG